VRRLARQDGADGLVGAGWPAQGRSCHGTRAARRRRVPRVMGREGHPAEPRLVRPSETASPRQVATNRCGTTHGDRVVLRLRAAVSPPVPPGGGGEAVQVFGMVLLEHRHSARWDGRPTPPHACLFGPLEAAPGSGVARATARSPRTGWWDRSRARSGLASSACGSRPCRAVLRTDGASTGSGMPLATTPCVRTYCLSAWSSGRHAHRVLVVGPPVVDASAANRSTTGVRPPCPLQPRLS